MIKKKIIFSVLVLLSGLHHANAQSNNRIADHNTIGWYMYFGDHKISKNWGIHTEYQWRRNNIITSWQQSLARVGINYSISDQVMLTAGYGFIETYPYGEHPIANLGYPFPEHRLYQQLVLKNPQGTWDISHRFRLEERWLGKLRPKEGHEIFGWNYLNRVRYQLKLARSLQGKTLEDKEFYAVAYDEIFIGFGKNIGYNFFDQNRIYLALGYKVSKSCKVEFGFLNQIVLHGRLNPTTKQQEFEYNNGLQASLIYNFDFTKKKETTN